MVNPDEIKSSTILGVDGRIIHNPGNEPVVVEPEKKEVDASPPTPNNPQKQKAPNTGAEIKKPAV